MRAKNSLSQAGQAMPEMLIVFPLAVVMIMAIIQFGLLYRAKAVLNNATFVAARAGSLNHGFTSVMSDVFFDRMSALVKVPDTTAARSVSSAYVNGPSDIRLLPLRRLVKEAHTYQPIEIIFPTRAVFNAFSISYQDLIPCSGRNCPGGGAYTLSRSAVKQIPFSNLNARDQSPRVVNGQAVSLEDANLLSIRSRFCYSLEVPVANFIIHRTMQRIMEGEQDWRYCQQLIGSRFVIPIIGRTVVRMQTGFRCEGDEHVADNCANIH